jgi:Uma2 family endonuclease
MIDKGILGPDDRVELLEGIVVQKMSKNPPHRIATLRTRRALERVVPAGWYVDEQEPITLADSEPEPDVAVIRGDTLDYDAGNPGPADVGLIVEVADTSLTRDQVLKKRIYGTASIPVYWILDLNRRRLEVYSSPDAAGYLHCSIYQAHESVEVTLDGESVGFVSVGSLLP